MGTGRTSEGHWKAVRAYGLDDLETWLESAPVTHAWLSDLLCSHPHGLVPAESWWASWSRATTPPFPESVVLAGREAAADALRAQLAQSGQIITVQGSSRDDVLAFVSALGVSDSKIDGGLLLARAAFIDEVAAWRRLRDHQAPLALAPGTTEVAQAFGPGSAHHLIVPVVGSGSASITLPPIDSQKAKELLAAAGLGERQAEETAGLARLSLQAARRHIASHPALHRPRWADPPVSRLVRRALLAGRWNESSPGDLSVLGNLLEAEYRSLREELASLMAEADPLIARFDASVGLASHLDAWLLMGGVLLRDDLESFHVAAMAVLSEPDPALQLPPSDRWQAVVVGKTPRHSRDLRRGLATTLALLGAHGGAVLRGSGQDWAASTVRRILDAANHDVSCQIWKSLHDVLPLLAEAAPSDFLAAVRGGLSGQPPLLRDMFSDSDTTDSAHSSLLWALETCAWSPADFGQSVDLLARLAEVDPDGRLANRPMASLAAILCPWYPQNSVNVQRRLAVLDALRQRHEPIAWKLMLSLSHGGSNFATPTSAPRFRSWKPEQISVTTGEYWTVVQDVCQRLLEDVAADAPRWVSIIEELSNLPPQARATARQQLTALAADDRLDTVARRHIWDALRSTTARHRQYADTEWALSAEEVTQIEEIAKRFEPSSPADRFAWLFDQHMPDISALRHDNLEEYDATLDQMRVRAAVEIVNSLDWPQLRAFASGRTRSWLFGSALARAGVTRHEARILDLLASDDPADLDLASSYLSQRFRSEGWPWVEERLRQGSLSPEQSGRLLLATSDFPTAWDVADALGAEVAAVLWRHFPTSGLGPAFPHVATVARRLLAAGRPGAALDLLALYIRHDGGQDCAELMATGLEELLPRDAGDPEARVLSHYELVEIFGYLERSSLPRDRLARLEWSYLPALSHDANPATLNGYLAASPSFFVEVISGVFPASLPEASEDDETTKPKADAEPTERQQAAARNAYRLLSQWRLLPGRRQDGTVDGQALKDWMLEARRRLREQHRLIVGDIYLGKVLVSSPADPDGAWPCVEVRDLLEALQSRQVEEGLCTALFNRRGVTMRRMLDGGDQEQALAENYREQAKPFEDRWPRTAAVFRDLAEMYDSHARHYDEDAERRRKGFER
jgi:hypothetical protein